MPAPLLVQAAPHCRPARMSTCCCRALSTLPALPFPRPSLSRNSAVGMIVPKTKDGRVVFMLPWLEQTIAGTTDSSTDITMRPQVQSRRMLCCRCVACWLVEWVQAGGGAGCIGHRADLPSAVLLCLPACAVPCLSCSPLRMRSSSFWMPSPTISQSR
jgi:hypothetical protein